MILTLQTAHDLLNKRIYKNKYNKRYFGMSKISKRPPWLSG